MACKEQRCTPWAHETARDEKALAPGSVPKTTPKAPAVRVEMAHDTERERLELERQRALEEEQQRAQNTLPSWHLASTVSGDRTGLGNSESLRRGSEVDDIKDVPQDTDIQSVEDVDYYARYASQVQEFTDAEATSTKRQAENAHDGQPEQKRVKPDEEEEEEDMEDMEDVI